MMNGWVAWLVRDSAHLAGAVELKGMSTEKHVRDSGDKRLDFPPFRMKLEIRLRKRDS